MATIKALGEAVCVLRRELILFVPGLAFALLTLPQVALSLAFIPFVPLFFRFIAFFIAPLLVAGTLAMTYEGREQPTSLGTFTEYGTDRYLSVLLGAMLKVGVRMAFGTAAYILLFAALILFATGVEEPSQLISSGPVLVVGALLLVLSLLYLVFLFFYQFYAAAIVYEDVTVVEGIKQSISVVRHNPIATLGFSVIKFGIAAVVYVVPFAALFLVVGFAATDGSNPVFFDTFGPPEGAIGAYVAAVAAVFVLKAIAEPFTQALTGTFYANHR